MEDRTAPATKADIQRIEQLITQLSTQLQNAMDRRFQEAENSRQLMFEYLQNNIGTTLDRLLTAEEQFSQKIGNHEFRISRLKSHVEVDG